MEGHEPMCPVCATLIMDGDEVCLVTERAIHAGCLLRAVAAVLRKEPRITSSDAAA